MQTISNPNEIIQRRANPIQKTENVVHQDQFYNRLLNLSIIKLHCK